ncbi:hypothetical protein B0H11DRAFT_1687992, partial [Mycena galericulata]
YELRAVIYEGDLHLTCRIIDPDGSSWYHDRIETGRKAEPEGVIHSKGSDYL